MRFSEQWLRELVDLSGISTDELCRGLTLAGLEVDQTHPVANGFEKVVVGRITAVAPHPQADKLQICTVDSGDGDLQIVCGAPNARAGLTAPLALVGASLGSDFTIKPVKLRGVDSAGMLCSARELGLSDDADGLMELPESAPIGTNLRDHLQLDDTAIEIDLTPNRADCLGMIGLAREVGAIFGRQVMATETVPVDAVIEESITIAPATADCPRYLGRVIRDIDMDATTPTWMAERLRRAGLRVISPTVDVTNYVMLELGQPMHAFDLNRLTGQIGVRRARSGENLTLLNDEEVAVNERHLLITDDDRPVALAGVMGGADTAVDPDSTSNILFEAAYFDPAAIVGRARDFGLHTDSSHRFERGVDPRLQWRAMERATELLLAMTGGQAGPICESVDPDLLPEIPQVPLRAERIFRLLGTAIESVDIERILASLGMEVASSDAGWLVRPPSRRFDIAIEEDLIEEIARIHGYDHLPGRAPQGAIPPIVLPERQLERQRARTLLADRGFTEAINYSFVGQDLLDPLGDTGLPLANPLSRDMSVMRTSLLPGLLANVAYNQARQASRVQLFELGVVFRTDEAGEMVEVERIAAISAGEASDQNWTEKPRHGDFFDMKGLVESLVAITGRSKADFKRISLDHLHPGQAAEIMVDEQSIGIVAGLHPEWVEKADAKGRVFAFELDLIGLDQGQLPDSPVVSKFPEIRRDLAIIVANDVSWQQVSRSVRTNAGKLLTKLRVFDEYMGPGIAEGKKSLAMGLVLGDRTRTLTDDAVDAVVDQVVAGLELELDAQLRG